MKKILDFLLIFALAFFTVQIFMGGDRVKNDNTFVVATTNKNFKIPNFPIIGFTNGTSSAINIDTCADIVVRKNGETIPVAYDKCETLEILPQTSTQLELVPKEEVFQNAGTYVLDVTVGEKVYTTQFEMKLRGTFGQIFVYLFYAPIYNVMAYLLTHTAYSLGVAIILLTLLVRILLIYPQHKMMVNQKKMQEIQPKIKQIQEKHKGDQAKIGQELLGLYKKEGVSPLGSCGFLLIQMPILIVIYHVIQSVTEKSNYFYIYSFLDYFKIENINPIFFNIDLLQSGGVVGLVLAVVVGFLQFLQIKLSLGKTLGKTDKGTILEKKKDSSDFASIMPDPDMMNKFMLYGMPGMVAVFTYFFFAGLGLYWGMTTLFMIFQQIVVNKIKKKSS